VDNEENNRMCRPINGFKTSEQCYFDEDCETDKGSFCWKKGTDHGSCAILRNEYDTCGADFHCKTGICSLTHGTECQDEDNNCLCRPHIGFKDQTPVRSRFDCRSKIVTYKKRANVISGGLLICHGDDSSEVTAAAELTQVPETDLVEPYDSHSPWAINDLNAHTLIPLDELVQDGKTTVYGSKKEDKYSWVDPSAPACLGSQLKQVLFASFNKMADHSGIDTKCVDCLKLEGSRPDFRNNTANSSDLSNTMHKFIDVFRDCFGDNSTVQTANMAACATPIIEQDMMDMEDRNKPNVDETPHLKEDEAAGRYPDFYRVDELVYGCFAHLVAPGERGNPAFDTVGYDYLKDPNNYTMSVSSASSTLEAVFD
jgi:hypothetical protein